ncbi:hypothetical protein ACN47E_009227 [Coniothyrium glycines]
MAEQVAKDVVKEAQSVGRPAPIDDTASTTNTPAVNGDPPSGTATTNNKSHETSSGTDDLNGTLTPTVNGVSGSAATVDGSSQDFGQPLFNGDASEYLATESQAVADASGGSDTDISRPGSVDPLKQEAGHVRANSTVKKPSTFKSVSVTKNFLAKSAVSTPVARPGDKAASPAPLSTSSLLTAKPRLVAKLGTGNAPRVLGKTNGATSGPDASKVWNKNQPVPIPPPKQFTDEELKQQYGIHLATRLQADEAGKEAKWADIDDDEDDWAPDTVQWMDGTKSSGAVPEPQAAPVEEPKTILKPQPPPAPVEPAPATTTSTAKTSVTGGTKTILKPGAHAQPATKSSLVLKGQPEKPTLVAKPSSTEKKSPWATLPPVERVPPVQVSPPVQQQQPPRFSQRESYGYDSGPPLPAKEIAPDDFNRSWRDERGGRPELFNSQSGRYEPVNDTRRGAARDNGYRQQPAVLQRPSQDGPAEPSAAFQTSRASTDMPTWGRRRNSSNVSGSMRRMSFGRPDMPNGQMNLERRESHSVNGFEPSDSGASRQAPSVQAASPSASHAHPASPYGSAASPAIQDQPKPVTAPPVEDPVEVQKRLMADKIERARQKKQQEQEAEKKAEAERKERIAKKLAALGPPAESKSKAKESLLSRVPERSPPRDRAVPASVQSPPKPPVPTANGEVAQYGMMKVHQPQPIKKLASTEPTVGAKQTDEAGGASPVKSQSESQSRIEPAFGQQPTQSSSKLPRDHETGRQSAESPRQSAQQSDRAASAGPKPQGSQGAWPGSASHQPRPWTSQVWGAGSAQNRALGNGTFDTSAQPPLSASNATSIASIGTGLAQVTSALQASHHQTAQAPVQSGSATRPGPIGPPVVKGPWGANVEAQIRRDDGNAATKVRQDKEQQGTDFRPELRETFKDRAGQAQQTVHNAIAGNVAVPENMIKKDDGLRSIHEGSSQQSLNLGTPLHHSTSTRPSRFFPRQPEATTPAPRVTASSKADSPPPPPETETHPAFSGNSSNPLVRLPRPSPVVRLPPSATGQDNSSGSVSMPSRGQSLGARPLAMNPEWQARFNKLLEKPGAVPHSVASPRVANAAPSVASSKTGALAPAALSKASLDVRDTAGLATVSLPTAPSRKIFSMDFGSDGITRTGTEVLFEDREFGSLPTVRLAKVSHLAANAPPANAPKDTPSHFKFRGENPFTIRRLEAFDIEKGARDIEVVVRLEQMRNAVVKPMPRKRRPGPKINSTIKPKHGSTLNGASSPGAQKERPRKSSQQGQTDRPNSSPRPSSTQTNAWSTNNNRSSPAHSNTTWARRAAATTAPVH